ncbi:ABC transporter ATP-binding protein [Ferrovibrio sp.]|uniref:ABC transporter ATP-binding protein n=1 Tax=Ferrovibrio sp. TaxID=1917215 RepID=UPI003D0B624C
MTDVILKAEGVTKRFGGFLAVSDVDLTVREGSIHSLIGPNGAGKTTCFNILSCFMAPTSGRIYYRGQDITGTRPASVARMKLVRSFQISAVFPRFTALQNVRVALQQKQGWRYDFWSSDRRLVVADAEALELLRLVGLESYADALASDLSYGQKRCLELATTLALDPELLLLDEPTAGMGTEDIDRITEVIRAIAVKRTILMVEHNLSVVAGLSDHISVLARGSILAEGDYQTVSKDRRVIEAYLGGAHA